MNIMNNCHLISPLFVLSEITINFIKIVIHRTLSLITVKQCYLVYFLQQHCKNYIGPCEKCQYSIFFWKKKQTNRETVSCKDNLENSSVLCTCFPYCQHPTLLWYSPQMLTLVKSILYSKFLSFYFYQISFLYSSAPSRTPQLILVGYASASSNSSGFWWLCICIGQILRIMLFIVLKLRLWEWRRKITQVKCIKLGARIISTTYRCWWWHGLRGWGDVMSSLSTTFQKEVNDFLIRCTACTEEPWIMLCLLGGIAQIN